MLDLRGGPIFRKGGWAKRWEDEGKGQLSLDRKIPRSSSSSCNTKLREQTFIPVIFHNLKGYDSNIFIEAFHDLEQKPSCIPQNTEKFISFSLKKSGSSELRFLDSYAFMNFPLADLAEKLKDFPIMSKFFSQEEVEILSRKGVFPYEWFDTFSKLYGTEFPEYKDFFSKLANESISKEDYEFGLSVYKQFCKIIMDYHDLYLKTDVLLLADVCQEFCNICHEKFGLDPFNYYTAPGFAWDCALNKSGLKLEALSDVDMYLFFEQGIRGGYSNVHKNHAKANHKYLGRYYDPKVKCIYLWYVDINSLYPTVMIEKLPVRDFRWATQKDLDDIFEFCKTGQYDKIPPCTISVNAKRNPKNFDKEKVFAMCPEFYEEDGVKKLAHTLFDKNDYVIHYRTLIKYLKEGMIITGVNKGILYTEEACLKGYIELCVAERQKAEKAKNDFLVDFWKLMINSVFGKTMENVRKRINFKLLNDTKQLQKELNKPTLEGAIVYNKDLLVGVHLSKKKIMLDKPIYTGQCILDNSKRCMYEFMYDYVFPKWGVENVRVCITDTDSLILEIKTKDLPKDISPDIKERFDTSKFKRVDFDGTIFLKINRKVLGKMKDESAGQFMTQVVGMGPKNYAYEYLTIDKKLKEDKRFKCIGKSFTPKFQEYLDCIQGVQGNDVKKTCFRINSKNHKLFTIKTNKVAMRKKVVKRVAVPTVEFETLPFGAAEMLADLNSHYEMTQMSR